MTIKELREKKGYQIREFATIFNKTSKAYALFESKDLKELKLDQALKLSDFLRIQDRDFIKLITE